MSYILDALRKSEEKRSNLPLQPQQQSIGSQSEIKKHRISLPLIILGAGALIVIGIVGRMQNNTESVVIARHADTPAASSPAIAASKIPAPEKMLPAKESVAPSRPQASPPADQTPQFSKPSNTHIPVRENQSDTQTATPPIPDSRATAEEQVANANIQSRDELPMALQNSLPDITIEGHIYDSDPYSRMVFINGKIRTEKQQITQDLTLEEITPDGVILSYQGSTFHMGVFEP